MKCSSFVLRMILMFLFLWLLAGTGLSYWGRNEFQEGSHRVYKLCTELAELFDSMALDAANIEAAGNAEVDLSAVACSGDSDITTQLGTASASLVVAAEGIVELLDGLSPAITSVGKLFEKTIPSFIDWGIGLVTAFIALTVFFGFWSVLCGSTSRQRLLIAFSAIVMVVLCPLIAFELTLSVVMSDFCVGLQDDSLMVMARDYAPSSTLSLVNYYGTCNGTNPIQGFLVDAADQVSTFPTSILTPHCFLSFFFSYLSVIYFLNHCEFNSSVSCLIYDRF